MSDLRPLDVPDLLRRYGARPVRRLGQNFLVDESGLHKIITAAQIQPQEIILEIGAGVGSLTRLLAASARQVVAVELDGRLVAPLQEVLTGSQNTRIIEGDILKLHISDLIVEGPYLVVANIPYYITSALMRHLLESQPRPDRLILTVQREVAERICAGPGDMSLLALSVQLYGQPEIKARIPAGAFYPAPKVDSAVLKVDLYQETHIAPELIDQFFRLAKAGFSQKRKTLRNALSAGMAWSKDKTETVLIAAKLDPQRRAETLSIEEWYLLTETVSSFSLN